MRERLEKRLNELKAEFQMGQKTLSELEARQANLRETLLRISGAIQVLEEELQKDQEQSGETTDATTDETERPRQEVNT